MDTPGHCGARRPCGENLYLRRLSQWHQVEKSNSDVGLGFHKVFTFFHIVDYQWLRKTIYNCTYISHHYLNTYFLFMYVPCTDYSWKLDALTVI